MKHVPVILSALLCLFLAPGTVFCDDKPIVSSATQQCLDCHDALHPGIVADWKKAAMR